VGNLPLFTNFRPEEFSETRLQLTEKLCAQALKSPRFPPYRHTTLPQHFVLGTDMQVVASWPCPGLTSVDALAGDEKSRLGAWGVGRGHASMGERGVFTLPVHACSVTDRPASPPLAFSRPSWAFRRPCWASDKASAGATSSYRRASSPGGDKGAILGHAGRPTARLPAPRTTCEGVL
jgi:hypothetical protein